MHQVLDNPQYQRAVDRFRKAWKDSYDGLDPFAPAFERQALIARMAQIIMDDFHNMLNSIKENADRASMILDGKIDPDAGDMV